MIGNAGSEKGGASFHYGIAARSYISPPTLPIVPPSYLANPGLDDLLNEDAKGELVELDSPLVPQHAQQQHTSSAHCLAHNTAAGAVNGGNNNPLRNSSSTLCSTISSSTSNSAQVPPAFNDRVKRSTRFLTAVPANVILEQVERILDEVCRSRMETPAGCIGRVAVDWNRCRLEVWDRADMQGPVIFALQLYRIPPGSGMHGISYSYNTSSIPCSPDRLSYSNQAYPSTYGSMIGSYLTPAASPGAWFESSGAVSAVAISASQELFLVEFIRGQLEIFAFKRFYQYIRERLSDFVKKDYVCKQFDPAASPM